MSPFSPDLIGALNKSIWVPANREMFKKVNEVAIKAGYLVHPNACSNSVLTFLKSQTYNPNATFFKSWKDIKERNEDELCLAQALHYLSTYSVAALFGEDVVEGNGFVPNKDPAIMSFGELKIINAAQPKEIFADIYGMLKSGVAMSQKMVDASTFFIKDFDFLSSVKIDEVANKEAQAVLSMMSGKMPSDEFAMLRVIMYLTNNTTMLIKSKEAVSMTRINCLCPEIQTLISNLSEEQMRSLSKIFLRYKPLFLAMKPAAPATINRIRRLAVKHHKPLKVGLWEKILVEQTQDNLEAARKDAENINNFKKLQLLEAILYREQLPKNQFYHIRNGKTYIRANYSPSFNKEYFAELYDILMDSLIKSIVEKHTVDGKLQTVKLPKNLMLVCPTSEKNFVGNIPSGSYVKFTEDGEKPENLIFGIYWKSEWGTKDFDLHYRDFNGYSYGWNSNHKSDDNSLMFSGDMTRAHPEASECFFINGDAPDGIISAFNYDSLDLPTKFKIWIAKEAYTEGHKVKNANDEYAHTEQYGYIANPENICFDAIIDCEDNSDHQIGCVLSNRLYFTNESLSGGRVPDHNTADLYKEAVPKKLASHIVLKDLLKVAGIEVVDEDADIDLSNCSKSDLLNFF